MGRYASTRTPDAPLLRATAAADGQIGSFLVVGAISLIAAALLSGTTLAEWVKLGFITPSIIAAFLIAVFGPRRRVTAAPSERPAEAELAADDQIRRLNQLHLSVLIVVLAGLVFFYRSSGALVMLAISAAHVVALVVLRWRLRRLERRLDAPLYQRLRAAIWREPLWAFRDPGHGDPEIAAALGRTGAA